MSQFDHSTQIQKLLDLVKNNDPMARDRLIAHAFERLRLLARRMFHRQPLLRDVVETDDVLQGAALRLHQALPDVKPNTVRWFFALAAQQISRELLDLVRRFVGRDGGKARAVVFLGAAPSKSHHQHLEQQEAPAEEPGSLAEWTDFHEAVAALPEEEREVVGLLFYQGLRQEEAAALLNLSVRTVKRLWRSARLRLAERLHGDWPEL